MYKLSNESLLNYYGGSLNTIAKNIIISLISIYNKIKIGGLHQCCKN